ncbi:single-stranded DNA-binding protein [Hahella aquimaris]|uniref:single-stranded DNA-binding protein n=1 Tax=Hahella sp. HNIBRBA332 TaxID=3015983 RepID=UPI00273BD733|nr:single-stranded DNA-binding protein [Hahella sp. HNIBRBA332]WLQ15607.1 single-stranded DNA-binding protein [Hahella sp. HNIBRBA332]
MFIKLCALGRDAELRYTPSGQAVATLALAYSIGHGDNRRTQWIDGALWGDRAISLEPHLTKGTKLVVTADDLELEQFTKGDGSPGAKIRCRIVKVDFASPKQTQPAPQPYRPATPPQPPVQMPATGQAYDEFDDIPF